MERKRTAHHSVGKLPVIIPLLDPKGPRNVVLSEIFSVVEMVACANLRADEMCVCMYV